MEILQLLFSSGLREFIEHNVSITLIFILLTLFFLLRKTDKPIKTVDDIQKELDTIKKILEEIKHSSGSKEQNDLIIEHTRHLLTKIETLTQNLHNLENKIDSQTKEVIIKFSNVLKELENQLENIKDIKNSGRISNDQLRNNLFEINTKLEKIIIFLEPLLSFRGDFKNG